MGAVTIIIMSLLWTVFTWPVEMAIQAIETALGISEGAQNSVTYVRLFIYALPIIVCLGVIAWGYKAVIKEREMRGPFEL